MSTISHPVSMCRMRGAALVLKQHASLPAESNPAAVASTFRPPLFGRTDICRPKPSRRFSRVADPSESRRSPLNTPAMRTLYPAAAAATRLSGVGGRNRGTDLVLFGPATRTAPSAPPAQPEEQATEGESSGERCGPARTASCCDRGRSTVPRPDPRQERVHEPAPHPAVRHLPPASDEPQEEEPKNAAANAAFRMRLKPNPTAARATVFAGPLTLSTQRSQSRVGAAGDRWSS